MEFHNYRFVFLLSWSLLFGVAGFAHGGNHDDHHDHHHHHSGHDHGTENSANPTEIEVLQTELDKAIEEGAEHNAQSTNSNLELEHIGNLQLEIGKRLVLARLSKQETLDYLNQVHILSSPSMSIEVLQQIERVSQILTHNVLHWNPIAIGKRAIDAARRYGPVFGVAIAGGMGVSETSELMSIIAAAKIAPQAPFLAFLLAGYGTAHGGDMLGYWAMVKLPRKFADGFQWVYIMARAGGPQAYQEALEPVRQEVPIDRSLNAAYFRSPGGADSQEFLVLENHGLWDYLPTSWRPLGVLRAEVQKRSFPSLTLNDLKRALSELQLSLPDNSLPFHRQTIDAIATLQMSPAGQEALSQLITVANQNVVITQTSVRPSEFSAQDALVTSLELNREGTNLNDLLTDHGATTITYAERLRQGLLNKKAEVQNFQNAVRFWELNFQLFKKSWALNRILAHLDASQLNDRELQNITRDTKDLLRSFPDADAALRELSTFRDNIPQWRRILSFVESDLTGSVNTKLKINTAVQRLSWLVYAAINKRLEKIEYATNTLGISPSVFAKQRRTIQKLRNEISDLRVKGYLLSAGAALFPRAQLYFWGQFMDLAQNKVLEPVLTLVNDCESALEAMPDGSTLSWELPSASHHDH